MNSEVLLRKLANHPVTVRAYHLRRECEHGHEPAEDCPNEGCEEREYRFLVRDANAGLEPREGRG